MHREPLSCPEYSLKSVSWSRLDAAAIVGSRRDDWNLDHEIICSMWQRHAKRPESKEKYNVHITPAPRRLRGIFIFREINSYMYLRALLKLSVSGTQIVFIGFECSVSGTQIVFIGFECCLWGWNSVLIDPFLTSNSCFIRLILHL